MLNKQQIIELSENLLTNQGNVYDVAEKMFTESFRGTNELDVQNLLAENGKIWLCPICDTWKNITDVIKINYDVCSKCAGLIG